MNKPKPTQAGERTQYFTFGFSHVHSVGGFTYDKDVLVKITAGDPRQVMFDIFGPKWGMQYDEPPEPHYWSRGMRDLSPAKAGRAQ